MVLWLDNALLQRYDVLTLVFVMIIFPWLVLSQAASAEALWTHRVGASIVFDSMPKLRKLYQLSPGMKACRGDRAGLMDRWRLLTENK